MKTKNKILIIIAVLFVITAAVMIILGFALSGADILGWFSSKWAFIFYTVFGVYALIILFILVGDWIKKL